MAHQSELDSIQVLQYYALFNFYRVESLVLQPANNTNMIKITEANKVERNFFSVQPGLIFVSKKSINVSAIRR